MKNPIQPTDAAARDIAQTLLQEARFAALAVILPDGAPLVTRVAFGLSAAGQPLSLIAGLAAHTRALQANPACSVLIGEPGDRGDPLIYPRLTLQARATFVHHGTDVFAKMAAHYLRDHPKSKLYIGLPDFSFVQFTVHRGHLNAGFGKAFTLSPADMCLPA
ncbi:MAG: putative heme iron utilization protein [Paracoccaceae bacterium]|jgi:putative heme iron utilization protein